MNHEAIADTIKRYREQKQLSQDQLADAVGVSQQAVANWENGKSRPKGTRLDKLYDVLGPEFKREIERNPELAALSLSPITRGVSQKITLQLTPEASERAEAVLKELDGARGTKRETAYTSDELMEVHRAQIHAAALQRRQWEADVRQHLPSHLLPNLERQVHLGEYAWQVDYLSDNAHIEFVRFPRLEGRTFSTMLNNHIRKKLLKMLTVRKLQTEDICSVILVVSENKALPSSLGSKFFFELSLHRIEIAFVQDAAQAAGLIIGVEEAGRAAFADHDHDPEIDFEDI